MSVQFNYRTSAWFVGGLLCGLLIYPSVLRIGGWSVISRQHAEQQQALPADLPYDEQADARAAVAAARKEAVQSQKFLMVTFGANWCLDCRTLHRNLRSEDVAGYTEGLFLFVNVDVSKFNRNRDVAAELGVDLSRGIPVAIFFDPAGQLIGTTNEGQLEPARRYSSKQILKFVREIAERSRIVAPDSVGGGELKERIHSRYGSHHRG